MRLYVYAISLVSTLKFININFETFCINTPMHVLCENVKRMVLPLELAPRRARTNNRSPIVRSILFHYILWYWHIYIYTKHIAQSRFWQRVCYIGEAYHCWALFREYYTNGRLTHFLRKPNGIKRWPRDILAEFLLFVSKLRYFGRTRYFISMRWDMIRTFFSMF